MLRLLTALALLLSLGFALAQTPAKPALKIIFADDGEREIWFLDADRSKTGDPVASTGKTIEMSDLPSGAKFIALHDRVSNDLAIRELSSLKETWTPTLNDFKYLNEVKVAVIHDFEPVQSGLIRLSAPDYTDDALLLPEDKGVATFFGVPKKGLAVTFEYKLDGEQKSTPKQTFSNDGDALVVPTLTISVTDKVPTISKEPAPTDQKEAPKAPAPAPSGGGIGGKIIGMLVGIALLAGVVYGLMWYFKNKPDTAKDLLTKAGIPIPDDGQSSDPGTPDPIAMPSQPEPLKKIILDNPVPEDPQAIAASATAAAFAPAPGAVANPRFVREDGSVFMILEGTSTVGREADCSFALVGETSVSRSHAEVIRTGTEVSVTDTGSTNGTWVNGAKIELPTVLLPGDQVIFGGVRCTYEV